MLTYKTAFYRTAIGHTTKASIPVERFYIKTRSTGLSDKKPPPKSDIFNRP